CGITDGKINEIKNTVEGDIPNIYVVEATSASTYDLLDCEVLLVEKAGLALLNEQLMVKS
ncbi:MAG: hypothetical protein COA72_01080, partial [Candidatus Neomarinimicrobiota bacterium]